MTLSNIEAGARRCFKSGKYSDLIVRSGTREFKVHKIIVCAQSEWFENATKNDAFQEGIDSVVKMDDDEPDAVAAALEFLYIEEYEVFSPPDTTNYAMTLHLQVYALADKLQIENLKDRAQDKFELVAKLQWSDPAFPQVVQSAYCVAPPGPRGDGLRAVVLEISAQHARELFEANEEFANMMEEVAEFGKDLSAKLATQIQVTDRPQEVMEDLKCPACSFTFMASLNLRSDLKYLNCPACGKSQPVNEWKIKSLVEFIFLVWQQEAQREEKSTVGFWILKLGGTAFRWSCGRQKLKTSCGGLD